MLFRSMCYAIPSSPSSRYEKLCELWLPEWHDYARKRVRNETGTFVRAENQLAWYAGDLETLQGSGFNFTIPIFGGFGVSSTSKSPNSADKVLRDIYRPMLNGLELNSSSSESMLGVDSARVNFADFLPARFESSGGG